jgi:hypothetical protein
MGAEIVRGGWGAGHKKRGGVGLLRVSPDLRGREGREKGWGGGGWGGVVEFMV